MDGVTSVHYEESTVSSVRSTISTASSGYAIISVPGKQREDVRAVYPAEPPPDYDDPPVSNEDVILPSYKANTRSSPKKDFETTVPLLSEDPSFQQQQHQQQATIVRISSKSQDLNIEIVSNPTASPSPTVSTFAHSNSVRSDPAMSPASTAADTSFLYDVSSQKQPKRTCRKFTKREKILSIAFSVLLFILLVIVLNFTLCIGNFTSKCH